MKRYIKHDKQIEKVDNNEVEDNSDFYARWYAKFGKPQPRSMSKDEFMKRLKEMRDFE